MHCTLCRQNVERAIPVEYTRKRNGRVAIIRQHICYQCADAIRYLADEPTARHGHEDMPYTYSIHFGPRDTD